MRTTTIRTMNLTVNQDHLSSRRHPGRTSWETNPLLHFLTRMIDWPNPISLRPPLNPNPLHGKSPGLGFLPEPVVQVPNRLRLARVMTTLRGSSLVNEFKHNFPHGKNSNLRIFARIRAKRLSTFHHVSLPPKEITLRTGTSLGLRLLRLLLVPSPVPRVPLLPRIMTCPDYPLPPIRK